MYDKLKRLFWFKYTVNELQQFYLSTIEKQKTSSDGGLYLNVTPSDIIPEP